MLAPPSQRTEGRELDTTLLRPTAERPLLLAGGEHMKTVQEVLGHSRFSTTADTHTHSLPDQHRQAAEAINRILDPRGSRVARKTS